MSFQLRVRKNLTGVSEEVDCRQHFTRILPQGAEQEGHHANMANALHPVAAIHLGAVTGGTLPIIELGPTFGVDPIWRDRQLDPLKPGGGPSFVMHPEGTSAIYPIRRSWAPNLIELDVDWHDSIVSVGDNVYIREADPCDPNRWRELVWLRNPDAEDEYGVWEGIEPRHDLPPIDNIHPDPYFDAPWPVTGTSGPIHTDRPAGWGRQTGFVENTIQNTDPRYRRLGKYSWFIEVFWPTNGGVVSDWVPIHPTAERPFFAFQISVLLLRGELRFAVEVDVKGDGTQIVEIPDPATTPDHRIPRTRELNVWVERLGIVDQRFNFWEEGARAYRLKIFKEDNSNLTAFYLDAVQVTQQSVAPEIFVPGRMSNLLWHAANDAHERGVSVPQRSFDVELADIHRRDLTGRDVIKPGVAGRIFVPDAGIREPTRVIAVGPGRDLSTEGAARTPVRLSNRAEEITRAQLRRRALIFAQAPEPIATGEEPSGTKGGHLGTLTTSIREQLGTYYLVIEWPHNQEVQDTAHTVDIESSVDGVVATGYDPRNEASATGGSDSIDRFGSFEYEINLGTRGTDPLVINTITVTLKLSGDVIGTYKVTRAYYRAP